jgi:hypothetical protein
MRLEYLSESTTYPHEANLLAILSEQNRNRREYQLMRLEKRTYLGLNGGLFASWNSFLVLLDDENLRLRLRFRGCALQGRNIIL